MGIFVVQGAVVGLMGTVLGVLSGVLLSWYVTELAAWLQRVFHVQFISASVYMIDYLPSHLEWSDVYHIAGMALALSILATVYPAWRASRIQISEALRYE
jgi:lipoprotein-releasing system permease protein